jgi:hypothetical protein
MLRLANRNLQVELLDPADDAARRGPRYCRGGYIWQVHDVARGPLVSGPEYPHPDPTPFNGQGLPESLRHRTRDGRPLTWRGAEGLGIGIGKLSAGAGNDVKLEEPCSWAVSGDSTQLVFQTRQEAAGFACEFDCFEHIHAAMRALDFMRMVRMEGGIGSACDGDEIPPHLRHPTRQGLTGKAAMLVAHAGHKVSLNATIDSKPNPAGARLRLHYGWSSHLQRYLVGWVSDLAPKPQ